MGQIPVSSARVTCDGPEDQLDPFHHGGLLKDESDPVPVCVWTVVNQVLMTPSLTQAFRDGFKREVVKTTNDGDVITRLSRSCEDPGPFQSYVFSLTLTLSLHNKQES